MSGRDQISYGRAARLRVCLAGQAADIADSARGIVPTYADGFANGGEFVDMANRLAAEAKDLLTIAVAYERSRGLSWEAIGETLGISRQAAHERYAAAAQQLTDDLVRVWLLGDDPRFIGLPSGAVDPAGTADLLDRWVGWQLQSTDPLAHRPEDDPERTHPVTHNLPPMDTLEHSTMVMAASALVRERFGAVPEDPAAYDAETRRLELGLTRRKVELYERMSAEEAGKRGTDPGQLADLLAGARARLAELESQ
jgi:hypothetical protein